MTPWRMTAQIDDIRVPLAVAVQAGAPCAIATLVEIAGSAPRDPGAQMLITPSATPYDRMQPEMIAAMPLAVAKASSVPSSPAIRSSNIRVVGLPYRA